MNRHIIVLGLVLTLMTLTSCIRDEIADVSDSYRFSFIINDSIKYNKPKGIELISMNFYHPDTKQAFGDAIWAYPEGITLNMSPGHYDIVAYSYANTSTKFTYTDNLSLLTAETTITKTSSGGKVMAMPAHFYLGVLSDYYVPYHASAEEYEIDIPISSPLESWRLVVTGIKGLEYARTIAFYVSHQYESMLLETRTGEGDATMQISAEADSSLTTVIGDFNTFGMVPGKKYQIQAYIVDAADNVFTKTFDITDQVTDPDNPDNIITFEYDIELQKMVSGGIEPSAEEWDEEIDHRVIS